jgi:TolB protein
MSHIYVMNADGTNLRQLTNDSLYGEYNPDWSPDGSRIAFVTNREGPTEVYVKSADGTRQRLTTAVRPTGWPSWSPAEPRKLRDHWQPASPRQ